MEKVSVINPQGQFGTIDKAELEGALNQGYTLATPEQINKAQMVKRAGEGFEPALGTLESALSAATFGLSTQLEAASGVDPAEMEARREANPTLTGIVGPAIGIAGSLLAAPEAGAVKAIGGAAEATGGLAALGKYLPVNLAAKASEKIAEGVAPAIGKGVSIIANPETRPVVNAILKQAGSQAVGSSVEGALYGLGVAIDEHALGDPEALGDKLLAHIGFGSALGLGVGGIAGGIGGAFGAMTAKQVQKDIAAASKAEAMTMTPTDAAKVTQGDFEQAVRASDIKGKEGILQELQKLAGIKDLAKDAPELQKIAEELGLTVQPFQVSGSKVVRRAGDFLLSGQPTFSSAQVVKEASANFEKAAKVAEQQITTGPGKLSEFEFGREVKRLLTEDLEKRLSPIEELYQIIKDKQERIALSKPDIQDIQKKILGLEDVFKAPSFSASKAAKNLVTVDLPRQATLEDLRALRVRFSKNLQATASPDERRVYGIVTSTLKNIEDDIILREARELPLFEEQYKTIAAAARVANKEFKTYMERASELAEGLGKGRIYSANDIIRFIDEMDPQLLAKRIFRESKIEFAQFVEKNFPDVFRKARQYRLDELHADSLNAKGVFDPKKFYRNYQKLQPEIRDMLFARDQMSKIDKVNKYLSSFPEKFNPSETGYTNAFFGAFSGVTEFATANARDYTMKRLIDWSVSTGDMQTAHNMTKLYNLEKRAQEITTKIQKGVKGLFNGTKEVVMIEGVKAHEIKPEDHKKAISMIQQYNSDPVAFMDSVGERIKDLHDAAPSTANSVAMSMGRAVGFLATKIPSAPPSQPLSEPYQPSKAEIAKFERYYQALSNPVSILVQAQRGTLTPEAVEAVRAVLPTLMDEIHGKVIEEMGKKHNSLKQMPLQKKMGLSLLLGEDMFNGLKQDHLMSNQASLASPGAQQSKNLLAGQAKLSQSGMSNVTLAHRSMTEVAQAANRKLS
jgi:hypothetical protein